MTKVRTGTILFAQAMLLFAFAYAKVSAGDNVSADNPFAGAWKLQSFVFEKADQTLNYPFGENPEGIAIYDASGQMSAQIMRPDVPKFRSKERTGEPADQEVRAAYEGFIGYGGTYKVDSVKKTVVFHIRVSSYPNWVGTDLKRSFEFKSDRLLLRANIPSMEGTPASLVQVWERVEQTGQK